LIKLSLRELMEFPARKGLEERKEWEQLVQPVNEAEKATEEKKVTREFLDSTHRVLSVPTVYLYPAVDGDHQK
jgi:hypothetical protein